MIQQEIPTATQTRRFRVWARDRKTILGEVTGTHSSRTADDAVVFVMNGRDVVAMFLLQNVGAVTEKSEDLQSVA